MDESGSGMTTSPFVPATLPHVWSLTGSGHGGFLEQERVLPGIKISAAALKRDLAQRHHHDRERYDQGKHAFIHAVLKRVLAQRPDASLAVADATDQAQRLAIREA
ncbi:MAG: hypothetical protein M1118_00825 [Chloroflexi bacterium]|nr:hypothetical protein [Chloroflexota bacterium]